MVQSRTCHAEFEVVATGLAPFVDSGADDVRLSEAVGAGMNDADSELVGRWMRGEEAAFADIVRRWEQPLSRFLGRLADENQVPDLLQETFWRVHRARVRYSENGHFSSWLFQIALNVARDSGRRRTPPETLTGEPIAGDPSAARSLEQREEMESLSRAVAELPDELREVLALRHDAGLSFEEMGRRLNVPASTLKSRFAAALRKLRDRLKEPGESPEGSP
jgi:RNA polymerase sigma-70 factor, ECF subfamily